MTTVPTCPEWCETEHTAENKWSEESDLHNKWFGDPGGASVKAWVEMDASGFFMDSGFTFEIDEAENPDDMDEVAGWCKEAASFMREIRSAGATE